MLRGDRVSRRPRSVFARSHVSSSTSGGKGTPIQASRGWAWTRVPASVAVWRALPYHQVPR